MSSLPQRRQTRQEATPARVFRPEHPAVGLQPGSGLELLLHKLGVAGEDVLGLQAHKIVAGPVAVQVGGEAVFFTGTSPTRSSSRAEKTSSMSVMQNSRL